MPPVKRKIKFLKNKKLQCKPHLGHTNPRSFLKSFFHSTNSLINRYPALSIYLAGYHDEETLKRGRESGSFFETALFMHLKILAGLLIHRGAVFYWRAITSKEVDFVLEQGKRIVKA